MPVDHILLEEALRSRYQKAVTIKIPQRGNGATWLKQAMDNARQQSVYEAAQGANFAENIKNLANTFALQAIPTRIEVYDNSHIQGANSYGCMVVANKDGFDKKSYRKFSVNPHKDGDKSQRGGSDFAMMEEVMHRRFRNSAASESLPDLLIIDGGAGQVSSVLRILEEYGLHIQIIGVAKGPDRNAGHERFFLPGWRPFSLPDHHPVLHFMQRLRDEAHRFAIGTHRLARSKELTKSQLMEIPGIGEARKKVLLKKFGSVYGVQHASLRELEETEGITGDIAKKIYAFFH
jgi:excinuclease ABC subunit C